MILLMFGGLQLHAGSLLVLQELGAALLDE